MPLNQDLGSSRCDRRAPPLNTVLHVMVQSINQSLSNLVGKLLYAPRGKTLCLAGKMLGAQGKSGVSPLLPSSFPKLEQGQFGCRSFIKEITLLSPFSWGYVISFELACFAGDMGWNPICLTRRKAG